MLSVKVYPSDILQNNKKGRLNTMYMDDDTLTPRDRISENMLRRMLDESNQAERYAPDHGHDSGMQPQHRTWGLENHPLAMVYAPLQSFRNLYDRDTALQKGTVFTELDLPFMGQSVMKGGSCRG